MGPKQKAADKKEQAEERANEKAKVLSRGFCDSFFMLVDVWSNLFLSISLSLM
jgi:hypothetical protein